MKPFEAHYIEDVERMKPKDLSILAHNFTWPSISWPMIYKLT
jgi:hypothetical protein